MRLSRRCHNSVFRRLLKVTTVVSEKGATEQFISSRCCAQPWWAAVLMPRGGVWADGQSSGSRAVTDDRSAEPACCSALAGTLTDTEFAAAESKLLGTS